MSVDIGLVDGFQSLCRVGRITSPTTKTCDLNLKQNISMTNYVMARSTSLAQIALGFIDNSCHSCSLDCICRILDPDQLARCQVSLYSLPSIFCGNPRL